MIPFKEDRAREIGTLDDESGGIYDERTLDDDETLISRRIHSELEMTSILNQMK